MNVEFVNPFLEAVINVLGTMASTEASPKPPFVKSDDRAMGDVTGVCGMVGEKAKGSLAISFTEEAILSIASRMLGEEISSMDETIADVVGEITNIVVGGTKRALVEQGYTFDMAIPSTVIGKDHSIFHRTDGPIMIVPFETDAGKFFVEVCFEK